RAQVIDIRVKVVVKMVEVDIAKRDVGDGADESADESNWNHTPFPQLGSPDGHSSEANWRQEVKQRATVGNRHPKTHHRDCSHANDDLNRAQLNAEPHGQSSLHAPVFL